jgi:hypothetical protein
LEDQRCCFDAFVGFGTSCYGGFLGDCGILSRHVCSDAADCDQGTRCQPMTVGVVTLPFLVCQ